MDTESFHLARDCIALALANIRLVYSDFESFLSLKIQNPVA